MSLYPLKTNHHRRYVPIHTCPYTHSKQTTTDSISLYTLKTPHVVSQNKAPQAVCPYTHSKQSTAEGMYLYTLKTKQGKRYLPIHTLNRAPQTVCPYTHSNKTPQMVNQIKAPQMVSQNKTPQAVWPLVRLFIIQLQVICHL